MTAPHSIIEDTRRLTSRTYWTAKLWQAVLDQDERWIPRGAWELYGRTSLRVATFRACHGTHPDTGEDLLSGPEATLITVCGAFDVEGSVAISDMELSWRQSVIAFMWRKSRQICRGLQWDVLHFSDPFGCDMPDEVLEEMISDELRFAAMISNEELRREWFDDRPLIKALRSSIIDEREARLSGPVLLNPTSRPKPVPEGTLYVANSDGERLYPAGDGLWVDAAGNSYTSATGITDPDELHSWVLGT